MFLTSFSLISAFLSSLVFLEPIISFIISSKDLSPAAAFSASNFSNNTRDEFEREDTFVKLVDGKTLAKWLYEYNVGIKEIDRIILKEIDDNELSSFN